MWVYGTFKKSAKPAKECYAAIFALQKYPIAFTAAPF